MHKKAALQIYALSLVAGSAMAAGPLYKPSSRSPEPIDIASNGYGASQFAPDALGIGDIAPDFLLPTTTGDPVSLHSKGGRDPAAVQVLIFYRGHW